MKTLFVMMSLFALTLASAFSAEKCTLSFEPGVNFEEPRNVFTLDAMTSEVAKLAAAKGYTMKDPSEAGLRMEIQYNKMGPIKSYQYAVAYVLDSRNEIIYFTFSRERKVKNMTLDAIRRTVAQLPECKPAEVTL